MSCCDVIHIQIYFVALVSFGKAKVRREMRSIPGLIYAMEQFEKFLIQLSKKSKVRESFLQTSQLVLCNNSCSWYGLSIYTLYLLYVVLLANYESLIVYCRGILLVLINFFFIYLFFGGGGEGHKFSQSIGTCCR